MAEIFQRAQTQLAGVFASDVGKLSFGGGVSTALVQSLNAQYQQTVARLYEVGNIGQKANVYYVGGRAQGQISIARVVGPASLMGAYYTKFGNVCNAKTNTMSFQLDQTDCSVDPLNLLGAIGNAVGAIIGPGGAALFGVNQVLYQCRACVITSVGVSTAAQDMIVNENSQVMFSSMDYTGA